MSNLNLSYPEFIEAISKGKVPDYYLYLIKYTDNILLDIAKHNQQYVAKKLNMTPVKLSNIKPLLLAIKEGE